MIPYECGSESTGGRFVKPSVKFYLTAILFVVFDIEAVFIYPWAIHFRSLGWSASPTMLGFLARHRRRARLRLEEGSARMGDLSTVAAVHVLEGSEQGFATTRVDALLGWARKYSLFRTRS